MAPSSSHSMGFPELFKPVGLASTAIFSVEIRMQGMAGGILEGRGSCITWHRVLAISLAERGLCLSGKKKRPLWFWEIQLTEVSQPPLFHFFPQCFQLQPPLRHPVHCSLSTKTSGEELQTKILFLGLKEKIIIYGFIWTSSGLPSNWKPC